MINCNLNGLCRFNFDVVYGIKIYWIIIRVEHCLIDQSREPVVCFLSVTSEGHLKNGNYPAKLKIILLNFGKLSC